MCLTGDFVSAMVADPPDASLPGLVTVGVSTSTTASSVSVVASSSAVAVGVVDPLVEVCAPPLLPKFMSGTVGRGPEVFPVEPLWPVVAWGAPSGPSSSGDERDELSSAEVELDDADAESEPAPEADEAAPSSARASPAP